MCDGVWALARKGYEIGDGRLKGLEVMSMSGEISTNKLNTLCMRCTLGIILDNRGLDGGMACAGRSVRSKEEW